MQLTKRSLSDYNLFWWQWAMITFAGFCVSLFFVEIGERGELGVIEGTLGGSLIGLSQALLLSTWLPQAWLWLFANLIAWGLMAGSGFGAMGWVVPQTELLPIRLIFGVFLGTIGGLWLGFWQWLILRQYLTSAWRWMLMVSLSWAVGLPFGWIIGGSFRSVNNLFLSEVLGLAVTWIIVGTMTGFVLKILLYRSRQF